MDFYDDYPRDVKVFSGEYAAHPENGMNKPFANTLEGALAEAAFLTGVEKNADVVILASYAPLLARLGYAQWSPDMIWFDEKKAYPTASYYVQKMYGENMGTVTVPMEGQEAELRKWGIYLNITIDEKAGEYIIKAVSVGKDPVMLDLTDEEGNPIKGWSVRKEVSRPGNRTGRPDPSFPEPVFYREGYEGIDGLLQILPESFMVLRIPIRKGL